MPKAAGNREELDSARDTTTAFVYLQHGAEGGQAAAWALRVLLAELQPNPTSAEERIDPPPAAAAQ